MPGSAPQEAPQPSRQNRALSLANADRPGVEWSSPEHQCNLHYRDMGDGRHCFRLLAVDNFSLGGVITCRRFIFRESDGMLGGVIRNDFIVKEVEAGTADFEGARDTDLIRDEVDLGVTAPTEDDEILLDKILDWGTGNPDSISDTAPLAEDEV